MSGLHGLAVLTIFLSALGVDASATMAPGGTRLAFTDGPVGPFAALPAGSWFRLDTVYVGLQKGPDGGIVLGTAQPASGSHFGPPDGSESSAIDAPWELAGATGMHSTVAPAVDNGDGTADLSGWRVDWNGQLLDLGGGPPAILATDGVTFSLDYQVDTCPECFGISTTYALHLEGDIVPIPEPLSIALVGGMLLGAIAWRGRAATRSKPSGR